MKGGRALAPPVGRRTFGILYLWLLATHTNLICFCFGQLSSCIFSVCFLAPFWHDCSLICFWTAVWFVSHCIHKTRKKMLMKTQHAWIATIPSVMGNCSKQGFPLCAVRKVILISINATRWPSSNSYSQAIFSCCKMLHIFVSLPRYICYDISCAPFCLFTKSFLWKG